ncbi:hypothetical protein EJV46_14030 [Roseococcus sp. SYP-B2431]|uniref:hypothetical protein n=1 Tax=Roseococcus sp. SYP-B2431 TaxID=2496640 RepID=UPI001038B15A|nr:hypothetical protein [Roseococcus sp. SYP-B2431]TCH98298.1 hypothetical protein EJV46_14030 [Roseococcus sp. SYP-B2431]
MDATTENVTLARREEDSNTPGHPEELRVALDARFGSGGLSATARCTPAGLVAIGVMVSGILLSVSAIILAARRHQGSHPS